MTPIVWLIPIALLVLGAGAIARSVRRRRDQRHLTSEPLSGQWLAETRSREEQPW
jgi:cytochrome c-type biogenesis protein CcmH/NrfF